MTCNNISLSLTRHKLQAIKELVRIVREEIIRLNCYQSSVQSIKELEKKKTFHIFEARVSVVSVKIATLLPRIKYY